MFKICGIKNYSLNILKKVGKLEIKVFKKRPLKNYLALIPKSATKLVNLA